MTNSLTVVAKVFSNTLIFFAKKCEQHWKSYSHFCSKKNKNVFATFQDSLNVKLANNLLSSEQLGPGLVLSSN